MDVLEAYSHVADFGLFQSVVIGLTSIPTLLCGLFMLTNVFLMFETKHRCYIDGCEAQGLNFSWIDDAIPANSDGDLSECQRYEIAHHDTGNITACNASIFTDNVISCNQWHYDDKVFKTTIISEWDLVCDRAWLVPLSQSIFMIGVLVGAVLFGTLADRYGRKQAFYYAPIIAVTGCALCSYSPSLWFYDVMSAITSVATSGMYITAFILLTETVGPSHRTWSAIYLQTVFCAGEIVLGVMALYIHDWRQLEFAIIYPMASCLALPFLLPESVLWLNSQNRKSEAMDIVRKAARWNGVKLPFIINQQRPTTKQIAEDQLDIDTKISPLTILKEATLRRWSLILFFTWLVNAMVYYSLSLQSGSISSDPFYSYFLLAAIELPAYVIVTLAIEKYGRRLVLSVFMVLGGLACVAPLIVPTNYSFLTTYFAMFGKGAIAATFALIYVYTAEIYPTAIRSSGLGICSMMARVGAILAPFVNYLKFFGANTPLYLCGIFALVAGILALGLPETSNRPLPQTLDDVKLLREPLLKKRDSETSPLLY
ncbi:Organic cation transporter protein [Halotydeus destructor]|nr:Organic cation transporter protein [Halotydeus destructor]